MKRIVLFAIIFFVVITFAFSQDTNEWNWGGLVRFRPAATIITAIFGGFEIVADWIPYVTPNIGIPVEIDFLSIGGLFGFGIMAGIEAVPIIHKEKSGLYLTALLGALFIDKYTTFCGRANVGYQIVSNGGFVFTPAIGAKYSGMSGISFDLMLDIGFAYRKR